MGVYVACHDPQQESAGYTSKYRGLGLHVELLLLLLKPDPTSGKQNMSAKEESREQQGWRRQLLAVTRSHSQLHPGLNVAPSS